MTIAFPAPPENDPGGAHSTRCRNGADNEFQTEGEGDSSVGLDLVQAQDKLGLISNQIDYEIFPIGPFGPFGVPRPYRHFTLLALEFRQSAAEI